MDIFYTTANKGNLAIELDTFKVPVSVAKELLTELDVRPGAYWDSHLRKPLNRAKRKKQEYVLVQTAGFGTNEFVQALMSKDHRSIYTERLEGVDYRAML